MSMHYFVKNKGNNKNWNVLSRNDIGRHSNKEDIVIMKHDSFTSKLHRGNRYDVIVRHS